MRKLVCENCGEDFKIYPSQYDKNLRFCSIDCRREFHREKVRCENCDKVFLKKKSQIELTDHNFCSKECFYVWTRENWGNQKEIVCENCGKKVSKNIYNVKNYEHHFCSWECYTEWKKGKNHPRWKPKIVKICEVCGKEFKVPPSKEETAKFCSYKCKMKKMWEDLDYRLRTLRAQREGMQIRPTKPERIVFEAIQNHNLPFRYVGDGTVWIGNPPLNPDLIHTEKDKVIEVFGNHWHTLKEEEQRVKAFRKYGFDTLVLWEDYVYSHSQGEIAERIRIFGWDK